MPTAYIDPTSEVSNSGWWGYYGSNLAEALDGGVRQPSIADYSDGYCYGYPGAEGVVGMANGPADATSVTQVVVWVFGYFSDPDEDYYEGTLWADLYIGGAWVGEQQVTGSYAGWGSATFATAAGNANGIQVKLRAQQNGYSYGPVYMFGMYAELTYTSGPATAITLDGPTQGGNGLPSTNFTVGANGTISGTVTVTPNDGGAGGTFNPTSVAISSASPSATFTYTPASVGSKTISVTNNGGLNNPSSITYNSLAASGAIELMEIDTVTQGTWKGKYGTEGYSMPGQTDSLPAWLNSRTFQNMTTYNWTSSSTDVRAIQKPDPATDRQAHAWYQNSPWGFTIACTDNTNWHTISLYHCDWDGSGNRSFDLKVYDTNADVLLYSGSLSSYNNGKWMRFKVRGTLKFEYTNTAGANPLLFGMMFDPPPGPATGLDLTGPAWSDYNVASSNFTLQLLPLSTEGSPTVTVTLSANKAGTFSPSNTVQLTDASRSTTFQFTGTEVGTVIISTSNDQSLTNDSWSMNVLGPPPAGAEARSPEKQYSGPLILEQYKVWAEREYTGTMFVMYPTTIEAWPEHDYTGGLTFRYYWSGQYFYDIAEDWERFGGNKKYGDDTISLAAGDMLASLGVTGAYFYYKFASNQNTCQNPTGATYDGTLAGDASYTAAGLLAGTTGSFQVTSGQPASDFVLLNNTGTGTQKSVFSMGGFVTWSSTANRVIWGYSHTHQNDYGSGYGPEDMEAVCTVGTDASGRLEIRMISSNPNYWDGCGTVAIVDAASLGLVAGQEHYLHIEAFTGDVNMEYYYGNITVVQFRIYVDGKYMAVITPSTTMYWPNSTIWIGTGGYFTSSYSFLPRIGARSTSDDTISANNGWGNETVDRQWPAAINDVWWANWGFTRPAGLEPKYTATTDHYNPVSLTQNPDWSAGKEDAYTVIDVLDPNTEPEDMFIVYGPVEDLGRTEDLTKFRVKFDLQAPTQGQKVLVSYRVSGTAFAADAASPAWSSWVDVTSLNNVFVNVSGVSGRYSQIRLKLMPNTGSGNGGSIGGTLVVHGDHSSIDEGTEIILTSENWEGAGGLWNTQQVNIAADWEATFKFIMGPGQGDGMAFVAQNVGTSGVGDGGGYIGYGGLGSGLVVEFDTHNNNYGDPSTDKNDPSNNHVGILVSQTTLDPDHNTAGWHGTVTPVQDFSDGNEHLAKITYNATTHLLSVYLDGVLVHSTTVDLSTALYSSAYIGVTAANGTDKARHRVTGFTFNGLDASAGLLPYDGTGNTGGTEGANEVVPIVDEVEYHMGTYDQPQPGEPQGSNLFLTLGWK